MSRLSHIRVKDEIMKYHTQSLPGIKNIAYLDARKLTPNVMLMAICGNPIGVFTELHPIPFSGTPSCITSSVYDNHGRLEAVTLTFKSTEYMPTHMPVAFVVTDANDKSYLIGAFETPHPTVKVEIGFGDPSGDASVNTYEVKYTAIRALLPCVANM